jgi:hypothetical protein
MSNTLGLRQKLAIATSETEVTDLLNTGLTFEFASQSTRNGWKNTARRRLNTLKGTKVAAPVAPQEEEEVVTAKKKRGNKKKLN